MSFDKHKFQRDFKEGCVFAYPTEAVFGLGCDPLNHAAMDKILALKQRPVEKGVIIIAGEIKQLEGYVDFSNLSEQAIKSIEESWPGPFTWLIPRGLKTPDWISGGSELVAVRVTTHELVIEMCDAVSSPLVSTSANIGGMPPAKNSEQVKAYFGDEVVLLDGQLGDQSSPSKITNAVTMERIR